MLACRAIPTFYPVEDRGGELVADCPLVLVEEFALKDREERFSHAVVVAITGGSHRFKQACVSEPVREKPGRVNQSVIGMCHDLVAALRGWRRQVAICMASATSYATPSSSPLDGVA